MTTRGEPYKATKKTGGDDAVARGLVSLRNVYRTSGVPTDEQKRMIEKCEQVSKGEYKGDPFHLYRQAEAMGIELDSEEQHKDGKWYPFQTDDAELTLMQKGAL